MHDDEMGRARRTLAALLNTLDDGQATSEPSSIDAAAARLEELLAARMRELEEKTSALEQANHELRSLTQNLDRIVRQRTRALAESESQLRRKNVELDRLNRMKSEFLSIAAHELRTPMTSLVGYLDLIMEGRFGDPPPDMRRPVSSLRRNALRLKRLIEDMLDISRLETGRVVLHRKPCLLGEIVHAAVDEMRPMAGEKRQRLSTSVSEVPPIDADSDKIHQVVTNLVANSIKYTAAEGEIVLTVDVAPRAESVAQQHARLRVWDNGMGIPAALRARIFEPFNDMYTAKHHTSSGPDSAGLGLYIARGIVELHGGNIHVDSEEGRYAEFTVLLPLAKTE